MLNICQNIFAVFCDHDRNQLQKRLNVDQTLNPVV